MYDTVGCIGVQSLWILGRPYNLGGCIPVGLSWKYSCWLSSYFSVLMSFFVTVDTMLQVGSFFSLVYGPLVRCSLHFLM